jgi:hypothetical protein
VIDARMLRLVSLQMRPLHGTAKQQTSNFLWFGYLLLLPLLLRLLSCCRGYPLQ